MCLIKERVFPGGSGGRITLPVESEICDNGSSRVFGAVPLIWFEVASDEGTVGAHLPHDAFGIGIGQ
jgi:hypothetical protein